MLQIQGVKGAAVLANRKHTICAWLEGNSSLAAYIFPAWDRIDEKFKE
jgi:hypothetical protein